MNEDQQNTAKEAFADLQEIMTEIGVKEITLTEDAFMIIWDSPCFNPKALEKFGNLINHVKYEVTHCEEG